MHLFDPIAEAVHDHATNDGMIGIERVPSAAVVGIVRPVLFQKDSRHYYRVHESSLLALDDHLRQCD